MNSCNVEFNIFALCNRMNLLCKDLCDRVIIVQACQCGAQFIELGSFALTGRRCGETCLGTSYQLTDHDCHNQKHDQNDDIRRSMNCKSVIGLDEKIVECEEGDQCTGN